MKIRMIGIDHNKADVALRERFSFTKSKQTAAMRAMMQRGDIHGCVLLATCNRTELWISGGETDLFTLLCEAAGVRETARDCFVQREGMEAVRHLYELACGMKSMVFAEDQILTQVREAAELAREADCSDAVLEKLFASAVSAAKRVKTEVKFSHGDPSVARSAAQKIAAHFPEPSGIKCLVVGNGNMGRLAASVLREYGFCVCVTVRQYTRGEVVIPKGCEAAMYESRLQCLADADVLVSATSSPHYTFLEAEFPRDGRRRVVADLAVPRDIEPDIALLPDVTLYDVDDLGGGEQSAEQIAQAERILDEAITKLKDWHYFRNMAAEIETISALGAEDTVARTAYALEREGMSGEHAELVLQAVRCASQNVISSLIYGLKDVDRQVAGDCIRAFKKTAEKGIL